MNNYRNEILNEFIDRYEKVVIIKEKVKNQERFLLFCIKNFLNMDIAFIMKKQMN